MQYTGKTVTLKDGRIAMLRAPHPDDAAEMVEYLKKACGETPWLANYPDELPYTVESEREYLKANAEGSDAMMIVAEIDGSLAGNCQLMLMRSAKTKHRAAAAIALLQEYCGQGLGKILMEELVAEATKLGLAQLELEYIEGNITAEALYRKMGFTETGRMPDAFRFRDGSSHAAVFMRKVL